MGKYLIDIDANGNKLVNVAGIEDTTAINFNSPIYNFIGPTPDTYAYFDVSGNLVSGANPAPPAGIKKIINIGETVTVLPDYQYLVYGDLTVNGTLDCQGEVTIINGALVLGPFGIFNNTGTLVLAALEPTSKKYKATFSSTAMVPFTITHNLNTLDFVYQAREGNNDIAVDLVRLNANQIQITTISSITGSITLAAF